MTNNIKLIDCSVAICIVATWVGGGFIVGTVEMVYTPSMGLTGATLVLLAYSTSFIVGKTVSLTLSLQCIEWKHDYES